MQITTSWMEQGIEQGIRQATEKLVVRSLQRKFGPLPASLANRLQELSIEQLENLHDMVPDLANIDELSNWLT
jgi:Domain of unknown function (DUF4351)